MKILTLCDNCRDELSEHFSVRPYTFNTATSKPEKKCANCNKPFRFMKMYIVDNKCARK